VLYRFDANGDGFPAGGVQELATFDSSTFPDFVEVSPSGSFAIFGVSGASSSVFRVQISSGVVDELFVAPGNFDAVFQDETHFFLSSNPGGFNPAVPNEVDLIELTGVPSVTATLRFVVVEGGG